MKDEGDAKGKEWTSKYLYHLKLERVYGMRKKKPEDEEDDEGEDNSVQADSEDGN